MARIEDLIASVADAQLRAAIDDEVKALKTRTSFGLVYEQHLPETLCLGVNGGLRLLLHEMHVASMAGKQRFLGWADAWLGPHGRGQPLGLALRRDLIATHAP
ncbi:MAG TPA: hypothetical protein VK655_01030 [Solirubrobacteraceae bacterium]|nr:hypothetical protein [Solirubrobacteraceae bacterium]